MSSGFKKVFFREIKRIKRTKVIINILFVLPLVLALAVFVVFKSSVLSDMPIGVYDEDNTRISRTFSRMLDASSAIEVKYKLTNSSDGERMLRGGDIYGFVVIPRNFSRDIIQGHSPKVPFYYNNQALLIGGIISKDVVVVSQTLMGQIRALSLMKKGKSKDYAVDSINLIGVDEHVRSNPYLNYSYFLAMGFTYQLFQILITFSAVWALGAELKKGSARRWLRLADDSVITAFFGKITPYFLIYFIMICFVYLIYLIFFNGVFGGNPFVFVLSTMLFIFSYQALSVMFIAVAGCLRLALSASAFYTAMGFAFVGVTYPLISMPKAAFIYGSIMPLTYYIGIFLDQTIRKIPPVYDLKNFIGIILLTALGLLFLPLLKKKALDKEYWYKL